LDKVFLGLGQNFTNQFASDDQTFFVGKAEDLIRPQSGEGRNEAREADEGILDHIAIALLNQAYQPIITPIDFE
jgi:hypothetical protein